MKKKLIFAFLGIAFLLVMSTTLLLSSKTNDERYSECVRESAIRVKSDYGVNVATKACTYKFKVRQSCATETPDKECDLPPTLVKNVAECLFAASLAETNKGASVAAFECDQKIHNYYVELTIRNYEDKVKKLNH